MLIKICSLIWKKIDTFGFHTIAKFGVSNVVYDYADKSYIILMTFRLTVINQSFCL